MDSDLKPYVYVAGPYSTGDQAAQRFRERYGAPPERILEDRGNLLLGPIPALGRHAIRGELRCDMDQAAGALGAIGACGLVALIAAALAIAACIGGGRKGKQ